jgi:hypothetical protein
MSTSIVAHENQILNTIMGCKRVPGVWKLPCSLHLKRQLTAAHEHQFVVGGH